MHAGLPIKPVDRAVDRLEATHSRVARVDRAVDRPESRCSLVQGPVDWAIDRKAQRSNFDRWPVDRPVDRMVKSDNNSLPTASFLWDLFIPHLWAVLCKFLRAKISELP